MESATGLETKAHTRRKSERERTEIQERREENF